MLSMLGNVKRACDGFPRRELLQAGTIGLFGGMTLPNLLRAEESLAQLPRDARRAYHQQHGLYRPGKARSVILLYLFGGPSQQDIFDLKPQAAVEARGEFQPIATSAPSVQICEHLPRMARWMHRCVVIRSAHHEAGCHNGIPTMTGFNGTSRSGNPDFESPLDPPSMGSVCDFVGLDANAMPPYVHLPNYMGWGRGFFRAGARGGFIGQQFDPLYTVCQPYVADLPAHRDKPQTVWGTPQLPHLASEVTIDRLDRRRTLLQQLDGQLARREQSAEAGANDRLYRHAFNLLLSSRCRAAFDLDQVDPKTRDRYGRSLFGESVLIARRLIEEGSRFVTCCWENYWKSNGIAAETAGDIDYNGWDTHTLNFQVLKAFNLPVFDQVFDALMQDLDRSGLLDETLIVVMGEMGRTPKVNASAGRDHWTHVYSVLLAGAGIQGGAVYGSSDRLAAFPATDPVTPADICSTVYQCLGISPETPVYMPNGRPVHIHHGGKPIDAILV